MVIPNKHDQYRKLQYVIKNPKVKFLNGRLANKEHFKIPNSPIPKIPKFVENYFFLQNYVTSEGAVSHNVVYFQPLPITRRQVSF